MVKTCTLSAVGQFVERTGDTMTGNLILGNNLLKFTSVSLKNTEEDVLCIKDETGTDDKVLQCGDVQPSESIGFRATAKGINAPNSDDAYTLIRARTNTVGVAEVGRLAGGVTPYIQLKLAKLTGDLIATGYRIDGDVFWAGENIMEMASTERSTALAVYTKVKEIRIGKGGTIRVTFSLKSTSPTVSYGQIYVNDGARGTERSNDTSGYLTFTEDIEGLSPGDSIQVYIKNTGAANAYCDQLKLQVEQFQSTWTLMS